MEQTLKAILDNPLGIVAAVVTLASAFVAVYSARVARRASRSVPDEIYTFAQSQIVTKRLELYPTLWELIQRPRENADHRAWARTRRAMAEWYAKEGGGMLLSQDARMTFEATLTALADPNATAETVDQLLGPLRLSLKRDIRSVKSHPASQSTRGLKRETEKVSIPGVVRAGDQHPF